MRRRGLGAEEAVMAQGTPLPLLLPTFSKNSIQAGPLEPSLPRLGLGIDQRPARPLVASERSLGQGLFPPSPAILTYGLTSLSALEEDRHRGVNALCPGQLSWQAVPPDPSIPERPLPGHPLQMPKPLGRRVD